MAYELKDKLVIAIASSALFDLQESDRIFRDKGTEEYRAFQREHQNVSLLPGVAFQFVKRLLAIEGVNGSGPPVEVILLSRNDPDTGLRVMKSIEHYGLNITRAAFLRGREPFHYIPAFGVSLFLSGNEADVKEAVLNGHPAGQVLDATFNLNVTKIRLLFEGFYTF